jgi:hypothetical protein
MDTMQKGQKVTTQKFILPVWAKVAFEWRDFSDLEDHQKAMVSRFAAQNKITLRGFWVFDDFPTECASSLSEEVETCYGATYGEFVY